MNSTFLGRFVRNRMALWGLVFLLLVCVLVLAAPLLFPGDPMQIVGKPFMSPFGERLLGTDSLGRDIAAGLAHGGRTSLMVGLVATAVAMAVGVTIGAIAGFYGGRVDNLLMRLTEFFQTIPTFLFAIVLVAVLSPSLRSIVISIAVISWPPIVRLVRAEVIALRERDFVQACICLGMSDSQIIFRQILPNTFSPVIVAGSLMIATAILTEAALSFLGLGDPNAISWGFMIGAGRSFLQDAWWLCAIPGIAILLTVLSINLVGEGINDALNPRLRTL
ncbi:ABC transporter permease subunit [Xylophilus rhododendri]|uniref:ABC transporter permease subunit n=1 Tax=Xylophilus rhododendri TaxID=2697032 RepID=A0A857JB85_9BURK|nr:ABC transporter permease [Xylophilus rhododendri]QHJ00412.1 ABC transporter permease subunit [Xylophilus rhododendri]